MNRQVLQVRGELPDYSGLIIDHKGNVYRIPFKGKDGRKWGLKLVPLVYHKDGLYYRYLNRYIHKDKFLNNVTPVKYQKTFDVRQKRAKK